MMLHANPLCSTEKVLPTIQYALDLPSFTCFVLQRVKILTTFVHLINIILHDIHYFIHLMLYTLCLIVG